MIEMNGALAKLVRQSGLVEITLRQLRHEYPDGDWLFTGDHCLHQETLFLHFANGAENRMWWVRIDSEWDGELAMSWNMEGMSDLV